MRGVFGRGRAQLGDRLLRIALHDLRRRKDVLPVDVQRQVLERRAVVIVGLLRIRRVLGSVLEQQLHRLLSAIDDQPSVLREVHVGLLRPRRVGDEDVAPTAGRRDLADVDHAVGELLEEHARLDVALGARRDDIERDFAVPLVRVRQRDDHDVGGRRGRQYGGDAERSENPEHADAARLQRDDFAVGRQPPEPDQNREQQRHRDRDAERLRQEREQHLENDSPVHPLRNEPLAGLQNRRDFEREGQADQHQTEGQQDLTHEVPIEEAKHRYAVGPYRL